MRKIFTVLLVAVSVGMMARTPEQAAIIASEFITQSQANPVQRVKRAAAATTLSQPVEWVYTQYQISQTTPAVYVFNAANNKGFVLVSAEDNARAVLGYSDEGSLDAEHMPANMRAWLQMYADELARADQLPAATAPQRAVDLYPTVEPLLGNTSWNQNAPYNNHCPIDPNTQERSVTGCMATATAQVMYHHKYPKTGTGSYSYWCGWETLSVDYSKETYDWDNMLPSYRGDYTQVQSDAVAKLMYHVGVACNMWYGSASSGAGMGTGMQAIVRNFDYDAAIRVLMKDYMDEEMLMNVIAEDLQASRPILIEALTKRQEGHAFVLDGMKADGYIHINWGWGGYANGYFSLSAMNPENQGIGGASDNGAFTEYVTLYTGIQPNRGGQTVPYIVSAGIELTSKAAIAKGSKVAVKIYDFQNAGIGEESGEVAYVLYQNGEKYQTIGTGRNWQLKPMHYYYSVDASASLSQLPEGEYEMLVGIDVTNKTQYPIYTYGIGEKRYQVTVTNDSVFLKEIIKKKEYYGTEYAMMQVTDLSAKTGANNLRVVVQTEDFALTSKGSVKSGSAMALDLFPQDVNSIIGSYVVDAANAQAIGTMSPVYTKLMAVEDDEQVNEVMTEGIVTITQIIGGHYAIDYHLRSKTRAFVGKCKIPANAIKCYRQVGSTNRNFTLTNEILTPAPVGLVYDWVSQLQTAEPTSQFVYAVGLVAQIDAIATAAGDATFSISVDGSKTNALYCPQTKWLAEADFVTGEELALRDTVVMWGNMQLADGTTPTLIGYVHDYHKGEPEVNTDLLSPLTSCLITVQGKQVHLVGARAFDTYVYNLAGEIVAMAPAAEQQTLLLPQAGCYILRHGGAIKKIIIQ